MDLSLGKPLKSSENPFSCESWASPLKLFALVAYASFWGVASSHSLGSPPADLKGADGPIEPPCEASFDTTNRFPLGPLDDAVLVRGQVGCPTGSVLVFTNKAGRKLLSYRDEDALLQVSQLGTYSHLVLTVWSGGSHVAVKVFLIGQGAASLVLDEAGKVDPDVIWGAEDNVVVIVSRAAKGDPDWKITLSDVYLYKQNRFRLAETVDREQRFIAASKLMNP